MSELIPTICRFSRYGCREQVNHEQRSQHEDSCPYQPVECLAGYWKETVVKCGWQGKQSELLEHVRLVHGIQWVHVGPTVEGAEFCGFDSSTIKIVLLCAFEELFWLTVKHDVDTDTHLQVLQYIGPRSRAKLFKYEIELKFLDGSRKSTWSTITKTCFEDINEILAAKRNIYSTTCSFITSYMNSNIRRYKFTVHKVLPP
jgi:Seven in absentia protein family.